MSLINKMLQDLDARGGAPGEPLPPQVKPVAAARPVPNVRPKRRVIAAAVIGSLAGVALAWYALGPSTPVRFAAAPARLPAAEPAPVPAKADGAMTGTITMLTADSASAAASPPVTAPVAASAAPALVNDSLPAPAAQPEQAAQAAQAAPRAAPASKEAGAPKRSVARTAAVEIAGLPSQSVAPLEPGSEEARAIRSALMQELEARRARQAAAAPPRQAATRAQGREDSQAQRAEGDYRRALASMQEGRMAETIGSLDSALRIDPSHEAARQTLVGLLIEAKRPDDAIRQLQLGLTQDPRQPALAMLLARLQIERGGSGIETLTRTLPYAGANPDYHAFLAGALQREQRHREAAAEYAAALRAVPANGVWWMGMGISLQAEKRNAEALQAFQRAQASGVLSAELQAFVERQVRQLGR
jgi:MSHA biogenesis protein MshN